MRWFLLLAFWFAAVHVNGIPTDESCSANEKEAVLYLAKLDKVLQDKKNVEYLAAFDYNINVTEHNRLKMIEISTENSNYMKTVVRDIKEHGFQNLCENKTIQREVKYLTQLDLKALNSDDYNELLNAVSNMQTNYAQVKVCSFKDPSKCNLSLEPEIQERIENSRDAEELKYYWKQWYDHAGLPAKDNFRKYVELTKKAAKLNNFKNYAELWINEYEDEDFEKNVDEIYNQILPFYKQLHAYVRHRLRKQYGNEVTENGNIPMHLLGNLWAQQWHHITDVITPYPSKSFIDVTEEMVKQGITQVKIFQMGDDFFQSLNMTKLPESFWKMSVLKKPDDPNHKIICHASAWDFFKDNDVRIKQCTEITMQHLYIAHHELGHIQYYLQYQDQPTAFRGAPNPGFHEAVGDVIALSVSSPKHLVKIGLIKNSELDEESRINELFKQAIQKIIFLPFSYSMDKYRYKVFRDEIPESEWNCGWWKMRSEHGGVEPAVQRSESDFDPPAKYHIDANVEYFRYFAAHIFQFQFHKRLCTLAGQFEENNPKLPLDNCDIYGSAEAGNAFKKLLSLGASKYWKDALEEFSGERTMTATAILDYFEPLRKWLEAENKKLNVPVGWEVTEKCK